MKSTFVKVAMLVIAMVMVVLCSGCCERRATIKTMSIGADGVVDEYTVKSGYMDEDGEMVVESEESYDDPTISIDTVWEGVR